MKKFFFFISYKNGNFIPRPAFRGDLSRSVVWCHVFFVVVHLCVHIIYFLSRFASTQGPFHSSSRSSLGYGCSISTETTSQVRLCFRYRIETFDVSKYRTIDESLLYPIYRFKSSILQRTENITSAKHQRKRP